MTLMLAAFIYGTVASASFTLDTVWLLGGLDDAPASDAASVPREGA